MSIIPLMHPWSQLQGVHASGDLRVLVFARQTVVAGVSGSSSSLGNVYGKHDWYQRERVRVVRAALASSAETKC